MEERRRHERSQSHISEWIRESLDVAMEEEGCLRDAGASVIRRAKEGELFYVVVTVAGLDPDIELVSSNPTTTTRDVFDVRWLLWGELTPSRFIASSRCRGMMVTVSISQRKATSDGVNPGGNGKAMTSGGI